MWWRVFFILLSDVQQVTSKKQETEWGYLGSVSFQDYFPSTKNRCGPSKAGLVCASSATCLLTDGVFQCICNDGYKGDGITCGDINECETDSHDCDAYATCTNLIGSFNCTCEDGFSGDGMICANDTLAVQLRGFYSGSFLTNAIKHATNSAPTLAEHTFMYISILYFFVNFF